MDKFEEIAPGRLSSLLREGLSGHHPLFDLDAIRRAFASPDQPVSRERANQVGEALLAMAREPLGSARSHMAALAPEARDAVIRLYFRLLDRAGGSKAPLH
jgi:hypothetical protein